VLVAGHPDLLAVGSVQPGVVPHNRPGRGGPASPGRADRRARLAAHRASLAGGRDLRPEERSARRAPSRPSRKPVVRDGADARGACQGVIRSPEAELLAERDLSVSVERRAGTAVRGGGPTTADDRAGGPGAAVPVVG
jgi:hypothetical protein